MSITKGDVAKARYWQKTISGAARSGISIRQFCRQRRLKESQFYWWQHKLRATRSAGTTGRPGDQGKAASFALVRDESEGTDAGIELVLGGGRKLRIRQGVDEATLRAVLAALEQPGC